MFFFFPMLKKYLRIHGDNIVECERSLSMIYEAIGGHLELLDCPVYIPKYRIKKEDLELTIELLSGHGRWGVNIGDELKNNGGILREGADSYISEVHNGTETFLIAIEYCSALPAGNNAWQRNGRALSSVLAGIPYLYMAELGGVELDSQRQVKAPRYPNPIVPFSYLCTTLDYRRICAPVYRPHPSISSELYNKFSNVFGYNDCLEIIRRILHGQSYEDVIFKLTYKTLKLVEILSTDKRGNNLLAPNQWSEFLRSDDRANWIHTHAVLEWKKKTASKVVSTPQFKKLLPSVVGMKLETIGAADIPICLIPKDKIKEFNAILNRVYPQLGIQLPNDKPISLIWITGYKPKGDDSRPDRGLCPLAKMVMGNSCRYMSIVYGPAKPLTWTILQRGIGALAESNGLWQSIYKICDFVLVDSSTKKNPEFIRIETSENSPSEMLEIEYHAIGEIQFSEHDTDTAIHQILVRSELHECLCNPPGGDWSGISYFRAPNIYRWTSLPRVSEIGGKRPDHVFQWERETESLFISIESKGFGCDLENEIGDKLEAYLQDLFSLVPTSIKTPSKDWRLYNSTANLGIYSVVSVGAFIYKNDEELSTHMQRGHLDAIMAFDFQTKTILHLLTNQRGKIIERFIKEASKSLRGFEVKIH